MLGSVYAHSYQPVQLSKLSFFLSENQLLLRVWHWPGRMLDQLQFGVQLPFLLPAFHHDSPLELLPILRLFFSSHSFIHIRRTELLGSFSFMKNVNITDSGFCDHLHPWRDSARGALILLGQLESFSEYFISVLIYTEANMIANVFFSGLHNSLIRIRWMYFKI